MPYNGAGVFQLVAGNPVVTGTLISSTWANNSLADLVNNGLSNCITKDGQQTVTANIPFNNNRLTGLGNGAGLQDAATVAQIQNGTASTLSAVAGTDTITAAASPVPGAYAAGQVYEFIVAGPNTTNTVTLNISSLGAKAITKFGANQLAPGDLQTGMSVRVRYDGTQFQLVSPIIGTLAVGKNRLINGDYRVSQYNGSSAVTPTVGSVYPIDRWKVVITQASKLTFQQVAAPTGFKNVAFALRISVASAFSAGAADQFGITQPIEGLNVQDFLWGTANAQPVTLQVQVSASLTGTYCLYFVNFASTRSYVAPITVTAANTPQLFTVTIPGDTGGTWVGASNAGFMYVGIDLGSGVNFQGTPNIWFGGNTNGTSGSVSLVANAGASITVSGWQLETGTVASPFEQINYQQQWSMCRRYYRNDPQLSSSFNGFSSTGGFCFALGIPFDPPMRSTPTGSIAGTMTCISPAGGTPGTTFTATANTNVNGFLQSGGGTGLSAGFSVYFGFSGAGSLNWNAEL